MPDNEQGPLFNESLAEAIQAGADLRRKIEHFENPSSQLVLFGGTLSFLLQALGLLNSFPDETRDSSAHFTNILQQCGLKCRNALAVTQQNPAVGMTGFPRLTMCLQGYCHTIVCFFMMNST